MRGRIRARHLKVIPHRGSLGKLHRSSKTDLMRHHKKESVAFFVLCSYNLQELKCWSPQKASELKHILIYAHGKNMIIDMIVD